MGTHPIFESDFDCLTDFKMMRIIYVLILYKCSVESKNSLCDIEELRLPENAESWGCNGLQDKIISKKSKCVPQCSHGYELQNDSKKNFHRCKSNGKWQNPKKAKFSCEVGKLNTLIVSQLIAEPSLPIDIESD